MFCCNPLALPDAITTTTIKDTKSTTNDLKKSGGEAQNESGNEKEEIIHANGGTRKSSNSSSPSPPSSSNSILSSLPSLFLPSISSPATTSTLVSSSSFPTASTSNYIAQEIDLLSVPDSVLEGWIERMDQYQIEQRKFLSNEPNRGRIAPGNAIGLMKAYLQGEFETGRCVCLAFYDQHETGSKSKSSSSSRSSSSSSASSHDEYSNIVGLVLINIIDSLDLSNYIPGRFGAICTKLAGGQSQSRLLVWKLGMISFQWPFRNSIYLFAPENSNKSNSASASANSTLLSATLSAPTTQSMEDRFNSTTAASHHFPPSYSTCFRSIRAWNDSLPSSSPLKCHILVANAFESSSFHSAMADAGMTITPNLSTHIADLRPYRGMTWKQYSKQILEKQQGKRVRETPFLNAGGEYEHRQDDVKDEDYDVVVNLASNTAASRAEKGKENHSDTPLLLNATRPFVKELFKQLPRDNRLMSLLKLDKQIVCSSIWLSLGENGRKNSKGNQAEAALNEEGGVKLTTEEKDESLFQHQATSLLASDPAEFSSSSSSTGSVITDEFWDDQSLLTSDIAGFDYGALDEFNSQREKPLHLYSVKCASVIRYALDHQIAFVDLGPTTSRWKVECGCEEVPMVSGIFCTNRFLHLLCRAVGGSLKLRHSQPSPSLRAVDLLKRNDQKSNGAAVLSPTQALENDSPQPEPIVVPQRGRSHSLPHIMMTSPPSTSTHSSSPPVPMITIPSSVARFHQRVGTGVMQQSLSHAHSSDSLNQTKLLSAEGGASPRSAGTGLSRPIGISSSAPSSPMSSSRTLVQGSANAGAVSPQPLTPKQLRILCRTNPAVAAELGLMNPNSPSSGSPLSAGPIPLSKTQLKKLQRQQQKLQQVDGNGNGSENTAKRTNSSSQPKLNGESTQETTTRLQVNVDQDGI